MHYTQTKRGKDGATTILIDGGPQVLGEFSADRAVVGEETWSLSTSPTKGARASLSDARVFHLPGSLKGRDRLEASLDGREFVFVNEAGKDWVIEDATGSKVGQFTGARRGTVSPIVEFDGDVEVSPEETAGLSWFARLILEAQLTRSSLALILSLAFFSVVAVIAFLV
ncbi:hypothetical protein [Corynebacterium tapiri]|uniref:Uncharacterized protein n=1 Tax=Corynebacterium tapiri TaxID=1448266 RepID=A0A5C4U3F7_9CORY|nr:hypothetical protein [Corynebacterium tapiri]TNL96582.1 hypothetical protein FHE74_07745 [Corynebacterium tapiri]